MYIKTNENGLIKQQGARPELFAMRGLKRALQMFHYYLAKYIQNDSYIQYFRKKSLSVIGHNSELTEKRANFVIIQERRCTIDLRFLVNFMFSSVTIQLPNR